MSGNTEMLILTYLKQNWTRINKVQEEYTEDTQTKKLHNVE